jgi:predicted ester cyclase
MTVDENKRVVRRWVDLDAAEGLLRPDYVRHDPSVPDIVGPKAERQFIAGAITAFPDLRFDVEQLVAEDDLVVCRLTAHGTHRVEFMGVPPSGRQVRFESVDTFRLADAKIAEQWVVMDDVWSPAANRCHSALMAS